MENLASGEAFGHSISILISAILVSGGQIIVVLEMTVGPLKTEQEKQ